VATGSEPPGAVFIVSRAAAGAPPGRKRRRAALGVLVVSDLADTLPRKLDGRFEGGSPTIVQACPEGTPAVCSDPRQTFVAGMEKLGLDPSRVEVFRPEDTTSAVTRWLAGA